MHGYTIDPIPYPNPINYSGQCKNAFQDMTSSVVLSDECDRNCFSFLSSFSFFVFFLWSDYDRSSWMRPLWLSNSTGARGTDPGATGGGPP